MKTFSTRLSENFTNGKTNESLLQTKNQLSTLLSKNISLKEKIKQLKNKLLISCKNYEMYEILQSELLELSILHFNNDAILAFQNEKLKCQQFQMQNYLQQLQNSEQQFSGSYQYQTKNIYSQTRNSELNSHDIETDVNIKRMKKSINFHERSFSTGLKKDILFNRSNISEERSNIISKITIQNQAIQKQLKLTQQLKLIVQNYEQAKKQKQIERKKKNIVQQKLKNVKKIVKQKANQLRTTLYKQKQYQDKIQKLQQQLKKIKVYIKIEEDQKNILGKKNYDLYQENKQIKLDLQNVIKAQKQYIKIIGNKDKQIKTITVKQHNCSQQLQQKNKQLCQMRGQIQKITKDKCILQESYVFQIKQLQQNIASIQIIQKIKKGQRQKQNELLNKKIYQLEKEKLQSQKKVEILQQKNKEKSEETINLKFKFKQQEKKLITKEAFLQQIQINKEYYSEQYDQQYKKIQRMYILLTGQHQIQKIENKGLYEELCQKQLCNKQLERKFSEQICQKEKIILKFNILQSKYIQLEDKIEESSKLISMYECKDHQVQTSKQLQVIELNNYLQQERNSFREVQNSLSKAFKQILVLKNKVKLLEDKNIALKVSEEKKNNIILLNKEQIGELKNQIEKYIQKYKVLQKQILEKQQDRDILMKKIEEKQKQLKRQKNINEIKKNQIQNLLNNKSQIDISLENQKKKVQNILMQIDKQKQKYRMKEQGILKNHMNMKKLEEFRIQNQKFKNQIEYLKNKNISIQSQLEILWVQINQLTIKLQNMEQVKDKMQNQLKIQGKNKQKLQEQLKNTKSTMKQIISKNKKIDDLLRKSKIQLEYITQQQKFLTNEKEKLFHDKQVLQEQLLNLQHKLEQKNKQSANMSRKFQILEQKNKKKIQKSQEQQLVINQLLSKQNIYEKQVIVRSIEDSRLKKNSKILKEKIGQSQKMIKDESEKYKKLEIIYSQCEFQLIKSKQQLQQQKIKLEKSNNRTEKIDDQIKIVRFLKQQNIQLRSKSVQSERRISYNQEKLTIKEKQNIKLKVDYQKKILQSMKWQTILQKQQKKYLNLQNEFKNIEKTKQIKQSEVQKLQTELKNVEIVLTKTQEQFKMAKIIYSEQIQKLVKGQTKIIQGLKKIKIQILDQNITKNMMENKQKQSEMNNQNFKMLDIISQLSYLNENLQKNWVDLQKKSQSNQDLINQINKIPKKLQEKNIVITNLNVQINKFKENEFRIKRQINCNNEELAQLQKQNEEMKDKMIDNYQQCTKLKQKMKQFRQANEQSKRKVIQANRKLLLEKKQKQRLKIELQDMKQQYEYRVQKIKIERLHNKSQLYLNSIQKPKKILNQKKTLSINEIYSENIKMIGQLHQSKTDQDLFIEIYKLLKIFIPYLNSQLINQLYKINIIKRNQIKKVPLYSEINQHLLKFSILWRNKERYIEDETKINFKIVNQQQICQSQQEDKIFQLLSSEKESSQIKNENQINNIQYCLFSNEEQLE